jgi:formate/nitrite transporter FocA (FNT family)
MINEEQLILEAWVYGGLSIVLICVMIWMVYTEKQNLDKSNGKRKK